MDTLLLERRASTPGDMANGTSRYYGSDPSGNVRLLMNGGGSVTDRASYRAFGGAWQRAGGTATPHLFGGSVGYYQDAVKRHYVRARHYDTNTGRWMSPDPIGFTGMDWNLYGYVGNRPVNSVDPSGLSRDPAPGSNFLRLAFSAFIPTKHAFPPILVRPTIEYPWPYTYHCGDDRPLPSSTRQGGGSRSRAWHTIILTGGKNSKCCQKKEDFGITHDSRANSSKQNKKALKTDCAPLPSGKLKVQFSGKGTNPMVLKIPSFPWVIAGIWPPVMTPEIPPSFQYKITLEVNVNNRTVWIDPKSVHTLYPSFELWMYKSTGATLLYSYLAPGTAVELFVGPQIIGTMPAWNGRRPGWAFYPRIPFALPQAPPVPSPDRC